MEDVAPQELAARLARLDDAVVVFHATWCGFCRRFLRDVEIPAGAPPVLRVDVSDEEDAAWEIHRLAVVPTAVRFDRGREVARADGILGLGLSRSRFAVLLAPRRSGMARA